MANTIRTYLLESLRGFYERLPLKKVAVDGLVLTPDASGVVDLGAIGNSPWEPGDGENSAVLKDTSSYATGVGTVTHGDNVHAIGDYSYAEGLGSSESLSFTISGAANATAYTTNIAHGLNTNNILEYNGIIARVTAINTTKNFTVDHTLSDVQLTNASGLNKLTGISYGAYSHVEGENTVAFGLSSHAEGSSTVASGKDSHAEGYSAAASGYGSHAEGYATKASNGYSHAEGYDTKASAQYSHAEGGLTEASGDYSHAEGGRAKASGNYSHAEGYSATASGICSHAEGNTAKASGDYSHAEGYSATASGIYSHAEGNSTKASGSNSHAEGQSTTASASYSHAEGGSATASGNYSHAEGHGGSSESLSFTISGAANATTYTTNVEHDLKVGDVLKYNTTIVKVSGFDTRTQFTVDKTLSVTKLTNTSSVKRIRGISYSEYSHAEGENTTTSGYSSHAEGTATTTSGDYSHAEGRYTYTSNAYEHAQGSYNMSHNYNTTFGDSGNTLNSIGVGVSDASRSNVIEVMQNGDVYVKGVGSYDGSNYVDASTLQEVINSGGGSADLVISITYADLKNLRDTSSLVPGMQYRITDYHTTVTPIITNARSADHQFDVIVRADDASHLNENGYAAHHEGDEYFANCNLEVWELQYRLDNEKWSMAAGTFIEVEDIRRGIMRKLGTVEINGETYILWDASELPYGYITRAVSEDDEIGTKLYDYIPETGDIGMLWESSIASKFDTEEGQGTILMMKDEYGNQFPYDFKNIQFKRWAVTDSQQGRTGLESKYMCGSTAPRNISIKGDDNFIWAYTFSSDANGGEQTDYSLDSTYNVTNNVYVITNPVSYLLDNVFYGRDNYGNRFELGCKGNTFGNNCQYNSFGNNCQYNSFGDYYTNNSFERGCNKNSFGNSCGSNIFGNGCQQNSFGNGYQQNSFGNGCQQNSFENSCLRNIFMNYCMGNIFGSSCTGNIFGNYCTSNTFGNYCSNNSFGNNCPYNSFGNYCNNNTFGNVFSRNLFGNNCDGNSFGDKCSYIKFGNSSSTKSYYQYIIVENGNQYIYLDTTQTTSSSNIIRNIKIAQGVNNTNTWKTITHNTVNDTFQTVYQPANSQTISV
jgi:hypothetical protein